MKQFVYISRIYNKNVQFSILYLELIEIHCSSLCKIQNV